MNEKLKVKIEKIKEHLRNNKEKYKIGITCFIAGGVTVYVLRRPKVIVVINQINEGIGDNLAKCNIERYYHKTITRFGNDVGRPGNPVIDMDTGNEFASQTLAAIDAGVSDQTMKRHLDGAYLNLDGRRFRRYTDLLQEAWERTNLAELALEESETA